MELKSSYYSMTTFNKPLKYIYDIRQGCIEDLEKHIGKITTRHMEAIGLIHVNDIYNTWTISEKASRLGHLSFGPYSMRDRIKDFFKYKLPLMIFG